LNTTNSVNPTNVALKKGEAKQTPKGIRKFMKNILSKSSGQKGKINSVLPSDSFNPSGSINSIQKADSLNADGQFYAGQQTDPFKRAKKIASSMNQWFDFDSFEITNANNNHTKELSDILKANPNMLLVFVGYTCNIGTQVINIKLGMKRVETVIQKFLDQGVPESQLIGESKGYDEPLVPNTSAENRAKNRRVEINVIKDN
jgi:outer membrane protein OmpA-like peptidoglycan-associated protein